MGDISHGPVSSMPGSHHELPEGAKCDEHPKRKAVARIQGETDSMGCEYMDVCAECLKGIREYAASAEARTGECDWCHKHATDLRDRRDYDEGMAGPLYRVCGACVKRQQEELEAEREYEDWDDSDDDWNEDEDEDCDDDDCGDIW